jgi:LacI family transcriptional regulator
LLIDILHGAEQVLREKDYSLVYCSSNSDLQLEVTLFEELFDHKVSGIILFPLAERGEEVLEKMARAANVPLVLVDRFISGCNTITVMADHRQSAYQGVKYLLSLGHRRIACISHPSESSSVTERIAGYEQAMREARLLPLATISLLGIGTVVADNVPPVFSDAELVYVDQMLDAFDRPTAVFCINDYVAIRVSQFILSKRV